MTQYVGIRSEGGLVPYDILDKIAREESGLGQQAKDFGLAAGRRLTDEIARAWSDAQDYWHIFQRRSQSVPESETGTTLTRKWVSDLLNELLGYELTYQPTGAIIGGKIYPISHRAGAGEEAPPIDIEGLRIDLDRRPQARRLSPQALVQEYLNNSDEHLWGIVSNGMLLRLLRDTSRTSRPSYLEFDLQSILDGNRFNEFSLFYRVCHRSRLPKTAEDSTSCWLEKYFQLSIEQGGRVREKLRDGVEDALKSLGSGFLRHPKNDALRERIAGGTLTAAEFHRQLLRLVYRLLFLMVAEERQMIVPESPDSERRQRLYDAYYSVGRLRTLAEKTIERSTFGDLWLSLQRTFMLFENGDSNPLGIPPLNGDLFSPLAVRDLQDTHLYNDALLKAIYRLSLFEENRVIQRVNYGALDVEELGSVYESLLDFRPVFVEEPEGKKFDLRLGSERKSTGSYYTRPELVRELIQSALVPVMLDRLGDAKNSDPAKDSEKRQQAILTMSVCDPACGSGHFLLAAARRLGRELAKIRTGEEEPTPREFHLAVRDVIAHCIYGVDVNPLAVDLCKLALWLEGHWTGKPLSFLDHRIKCGNSLIGVLDLSTLKDGIPDDAFSAVTGDDKKVAAAFKRRNRNERTAAALSQKRLSFEAVVHQHLPEYVELAKQLIEVREDVPDDVRRKSGLYEQSRADARWLHDHQAANAWTSAFFALLGKHNDPAVPTYELFLEFVSGQAKQPMFLPATEALARDFLFFHWLLEFPGVFEKGGFDVVLGNPPWDMLQLDPRDFFLATAPEISNAGNTAERERLIQGLSDSRPSLYRSYLTKKHGIEGYQKFVHTSGRFPFTSYGRINLMALFAELSRNILKKSGRAGILIPTGIATDSFNQFFFADLVRTNSLCSLYDFENRERLFPDVDSRMKFCLLTISSTVQPRTEFAFFTTRTELLRDERRRFSLSSSDIGLLNPNTRTCPVFRSQPDAQLTSKVYKSVPILNNESTKHNPWNFKGMLMFMMNTDSKLFHGSRQPELVPLYEAKMIWHFDHRWATFDGEFRECNAAEKAKSEYAAQPRYWVASNEVQKRLGDWKRDWLVVFRDITNATNERTVIFSVIPRVGVGNNAPVAVVNGIAPELLCCLLANFNSIVLDYIARQKLGGTHLNFFILNQLPVLPPDTYNHEDIEFVLDRVAELVCTSDDLAVFGRDIGRNGTPFTWEPSRRAQLMAELDSYYAHLYGLSRDEMRYILDPKDVYGEDFPSETFRVLKEHEEKEFGEYRTRRLVLEAFEKLAESPRFCDEMPKRHSVITPTDAMTKVGE